MRKQVGEICGVRMVVDDDGQESTRPKTLLNALFICCLAIAVLLVSEVILSLLVRH